jgi:hypothetical protein
VGSEPHEESAVAGGVADQNRDNHPTPSRSGVAGTTGISDKPIAESQGTPDLHKETSGEWRNAGKNARKAVLWVIGIVVTAVVGAIVAPFANGLFSSPAHSNNAARRIIACERAHGLSLAQEKRAPRAGETSIALSALPAGASQVAFASCGWPPPPGADPDGYRAITVTTSNGPGLGDASNRDFVDRIESHCKVLRLSYIYELTGSQIPFAPFKAAPGEIWAPGGHARYHFMRVGKIGPSEYRLGLSFYPAPTEVVVIHGQEILKQIQCLA